MSRIHGKKFIQALLDSGVVAPEQAVRRVVIDASADGVVVMYVERYGDERLLQVATSLDGVQIREVTPKADERFFIQDPNGAPDEGVHLG